MGWGRAGTVPTALQVDLRAIGLPRPAALAVKVDYVCDDVSVPCLRPKDTLSWVVIEAAALTFGEMEASGTDDTHCTARRRQLTASALIDHWEDLIHQLVCVRALPRSCVCVNAYVSVWLRERGGGRI